MKTITGVILAAGNSVRYGKKHNKNLELVNNKEIILYSLETFVNNNLINDIILVVKPSEYNTFKRLIDKQHYNKKITIIHGGNERKESVYNALNSTNSDIILIHDGARPLVTDRMINECISSMDTYKGVTVGDKSKDTVKIINENNEVVTTTNRANTVLIQTPQCFDRQLLLELHNKYRDINLTDDCQLLELDNYKVKIIEGDYRNIKLTYISDLDIIKRYLWEVSNMKNIDYLRSLDRVVLPREFTYFNHCTGYLPDSVKERMVNGKYAHGWSYIPTDEFIIDREMSFVERKGRLDSCLDYRKPISETSIIYTLSNYAKPFMIRIVMPRREYIRSNDLKDDYRGELARIYSGLGDGRHEKLPGKTRILIFGSSQVDEISGKKVDILYGVREQDIEWYTELVKETLNIGNAEDFIMPDNLDRYSDFGFLMRSTLLPKDKSFDRFKRIDGLSEFEMEYYEDYKDYFQIYNVDGILQPIPQQENFKIHKKFDSTYVDKDKLYL